MMESIFTSINIWFLCAWWVRYGYAGYTYYFRVYLLPVHWVMTESVDDELKSVSRI